MRYISMRPSSLSGSVPCGAVMSASAAASTGVAAVVRAVLTAPYVAALQSRTMALMMAGTLPLSDARASTIRGCGQSVMRW